MENKKTRRKPITKKLRFEVFKRDAFTCQYCGRMAPDVILDVDHINPVSNGGDNDIVNLITSCKDCNRGKGKRKLLIDFYRSWSDVKSAILEAIQCQQ